MSIFQTLHRSILILFAVVVISIVTLAHYSVSRIVAEQSRVQQQSLSPALQLIAEQLLQPLHVAQTLAKSREIMTIMTADEFDQAAILKTLKRLEQEFGLLFFVASEKHRMQVKSDGQEVALRVGEVNWYFKYRDHEANAVADIGQWEDPHFYIDLKIFDDNGRFVGFFGTGQSLEYFLDIFNQYKAEFGYDFIFVDQNKNITLTSDPELTAAYSKFNNLTELPWYQNLPQQVIDSGTLNNQLIRYKGNESLVAEVNIAPFDWTLYLLTPLQARQKEISRTFIISVVTLLVVIFALFMLIYHMLYYFRREINNRESYQPLKQLHNRHSVTQHYDRLQQKGQTISVLLIEIDKLHRINDTYGYDTGDEVMTSVANFIWQHVRAEDILGRWSSEEMILLLPNKGPHEAYEIAQSLRDGLSKLHPVSSKSELSITASFGVSFTAVARPLTEVVSSADDALYQAKLEGRNLVRMQLIESV